MDPLAGKKNEDDSSLTPWELIDPDEPANGPAPKPQADDEAEGVAAYLVETQAPTLAPHVEAMPESEPVATPAETIVANAIVPQAEISAPTEPVAISQEPWQWDQVEAVQRVDSLCTLPQLVFEAELPAQSEEASLPAEAVIAPEPAQSESDSLLDLCIGEALAEPTASQSPESSTTVTTAIDPHAESSAAADSGTTEMFGETIDALDAMPDTIEEITDITQAVGEAPPVEVADHALIVEASTETVEDVPVSADALRDVLEAATISEPIETEFTQTIPDEIAPKPEPEAQPQVRTYAPPQEEEWLDDEEEAEYDEADEEDADLAEAVFTEDEADIPEPRWEDPELDGELASVASDGGGWTIPLLCAGIAIIACCMVMPQIDANRRLAYEKMTLKSDLVLIQKQVSVNDEFLKKIVDDPSLAERLAQRQLKRVRKGQHVLKIRDEKPDMSPFQITAVSPPPAPPPYKPLSGTIAYLCYSARNRLYLTGIALAMIAFGLVLGATPQKTGGRASA
ncbi:MAG TPA: hypothetical protein VFW23_09245 [Tepidisphaeraceae bacterium]|nr:hypothetical protein [Tepidisphaeraceae bacterium]